MQASNLPKKEFRIMVIRMLKYLDGNSPRYARIKMK